MDTIPQDHTSRNQPMLPKSSGIYKITCISTQKVYIGSTVNFYDRRKAHFCLLRLNKHGNPHLQNSWNKYGEDAFTFEIIEYVLFPELLTYREQYWIDTLKPAFNMAPVAGTRRGIKASPETRAKMRLAKSGHKPTSPKNQSLEAREKNRLAQLGRKHTPETLAKLKGRKMPPEAIEKIRQSRMGNKSRLGLPHKPETIEKMRQAKLGRKNPRKGK